MMVELENFAAGPGSSSNTESENMQDERGELNLENMLNREINRDTSADQK